MFPYLYEIFVIGIDSGSDARLHRCPLPCQHVYVIPGQAERALIAPEGAQRPQRRLLVNRVAGEPGQRPEFDDVGADAGRTGYWGLALRNTRPEV